VSTSVGDSVATIDDGFGTAEERAVCAALMRSLHARARGVAAGARISERPHRRESVVASQV
jgi:hypothetical protein